LPTSLVIQHQHLLPSSERLVRAPKELHGALLRAALAELCEAVTFLTQRIATKTSWSELWAMAWGRSKETKALAQPA